MTCHDLQCLATTPGVHTSSQSSGYYSNNLCLVLIRVIHAKASYHNGTTTTADHVSLSYTCKFRLWNWWKEFEFVYTCTYSKHTRMHPTHMYMCVRMFLHLCMYRLYMYADLFVWLYSYTNTDARNISKFNYSLHNFNPILSSLLLILSVFVLPWNLCWWNMLTQEKQMKEM